MRLFVGNFPYFTDADNLRDLFSHFGPVVDATTIIDRETRKAKGFGFVEMSDADARKAIAGLNGRDYHGRSLTVHEAKPRPVRPERRRQQD